MKGTKIEFTDVEHKMLANKEFLLTKITIIKKVSKQFSLLQGGLENIVISEGLDQKLPVNIRDKKISKGENYKGLPFVILDFPQSFSKENIFTYRTMFWWGNFFSFTLFLKGSPLHTNLHLLKENLLQSEDKELFISTGNALWEYHYLENNFRKFNELAENDLERILDKPFLKLSYKMPVTKTNEIIARGTDSFRKLMKFYLSSYRAF